MAAFAGLFQFEDRAPANDLLTEIDEGGDDLLQIHHARPAAGQRQHVAAERGLQRREAVKLRQHHLGHRVALQLHHHADAVAIGLVAQV